jgi:uncharacterized protein (DUF302 family)
MKQADYALHREFPGISYDSAVEKVTAALKEEGFGVLTTIDVKKTLKEKIDADFKPYVILGACNPNLAHRALTTNDNVGLLLACNVVVAETDSGSEIGIIDPTAMMGVLGTDALEPVAAEAHERLSRVLDGIQ